MFGPDYTAGCPPCSAIADGFNGFAVHLANHDVMLWAVSRAPLDKLQAYKQRMGWSFPWASSPDTDFNYDFDVSLTEEQQRVGGRIQLPARAAATGRPTSRQTGRVAECAATTGTDWPTYTRERPGHERVRARGRRRLPHLLRLRRGLDGLWGMYQWLDRAPRGRNEQRAGAIRSTSFAGTTSTPADRAARAVSAGRRRRSRTPGTGVRRSADQSSAKEGGSSSSPVCRRSPARLSGFPARPLP